MRVRASRGANGIDGATPTAAGVALGSGRPTVALIGDVAFLHDTNALLGLADRGAHLVVVVVDNDGGGIFSFLPQADLLPTGRFERLYGTPHGVDCGALSELHRLPVVRPGTADAVGPAVTRALEAGGDQGVHLGADPAANPSVHQEIAAAVAAAVSGL